MLNNESLYKAIEDAAIHDKALVIPEPRTEKIRTVMVSPTKFIVEGVYWRGDDGNVYQPVLEAEARLHCVVAMYVVGSVSLDWASSGITDMFRPENRYYTVI